MATDHASLLEMDEHQRKLIPLLELRDQLRLKLMREVPEYRQLLALNEVIEAYESNPRAPAVNGLEPAPKQTIEGLASAFIKLKGEPQPIREVFAYIDRVKGFPDKDKARVNVVSMLSKGNALRSVRWKGSPAWWFNGMALPKEPLSGAAP